MQASSLGLEGVAVGPALGLACLHLRESILAGAWEDRFDRSETEVEHHWQRTGGDRQKRIGVRGCKGNGS